MARFLKNPQLAPGSTGAILPVVPSSAYGDTPVSGLIRFNQATSRIEFYYNNAWSQVAKIGTVQIVTDSFTGDGVTTTFSMSQIESDANSIAVFVGGVYQQANLNYSVNGTTTISFSTAPPAVTLASPTAIIVIHNINSTNVAA